MKTRRKPQKPVPLIAEMYQINSYSYTTLND